MRSFEVDFIYIHPETDLEYVIEAEAIVLKGDPDTDASDWDAKDFVEIVDVAVYFDGQRVAPVNIPDKVVYDKIEEMVREAQLKKSFEDETGGF